MEQPEVTKYQKFVMERWQRSAIKEHPKNPRRITESAKKKLRDKMKEVGLLQPPIVNRRTGYLLGGHQRLAVMDSLEHYKPGKTDYSLDVAVVDLPEAEEIAMIVFLNNASAQGSWDTDLLAELGQGVGFDEMGFDRLDVEILFDGDSRVDISGMFADTADAEETKGNIESIKEHNRATGRKSGLDKFEDSNARQTKKDVSIDYYVTVVCRDAEEKERLMKHLGIPKGEVYITPAEIFSLGKKV